MANEAVYDPVPLSITPFAVCDYEVDAMHVSDTELGRRYAVALSGRWEGEQLAATVLPGSAAWNEHHGSVNFTDARINLRLDSGALAFASYQGRAGAGGIFARMQIRTNDAAVAWLNGAVFVQSGTARGVEGVQYTVYRAGPGSSAPETDSSRVRHLARARYHVGVTHLSGDRVVAPIVGRWDGALSARVIPPSADWLRTRPHGGDTDDSLLLETDDGELLVASSVGTVASDGALAGVIFETGSEHLDRLNGIVAVAIGSVGPSGDEVTYDIYELDASEKNR